MYVLTNNELVIKFPYTLLDLRKDNPNVSFPKEMSNDDLVFWNVFPVIQQKPPDYNPILENLIQLNPFFLNGTWFQKWSVVKLSEKECKKRLEEQAALIRQERNKRLMDCDWTQFPNSPANSEVWEIYRQELRNLTLQDGFPLNIKWPIEPKN